MLIKIPLNYITIQFKYTYLYLKYHSTSFLHPRENARSTRRRREIREIAVYEASFQRIRHDPRISR